MRLIVGRRMKVGTTRASVRQPRWQPVVGIPNACRLPQLSTRPPRQSRIVGGSRRGVFRISRSQTHATKRDGAPVAGPGSASRHKMSPRTPTDTPFRDKPPTSPLGKHRPFVASKDAHELTSLPWVAINLQNAAACSASRPPSGPMNVFNFCSTSPTRGRLDEAMCRCSALGVIAKTSSFKIGLL